MFTIIGWVIYGLVVGFVAKFLHPGEDPKGVLSTMGVGVAGSFVGGFIHWILGFGGGPISSSGLVFGIVGGVAVLAAWKYFTQKNDFDPRDMLRK